mmetsp:Transcript_48172/g.119317  ORF Transcript_48172/g.119317 Transcript_48172/m.119317 type:complete len:207 (-) Transcript_48172:1267-1887(-)
MEGSKMRASCSYFMWVRFAENTASAACRSRASSLAALCAYLDLTSAADHMDTTHTDDKATRENDLKDAPPCRKAAVKNDRTAAVGRNGDVPIEVERGIEFVVPRGDRDVRQALVSERFGEMCHAAHVARRGRGRGRGRGGAGGRRRRRRRPRRGCRDVERHEEGRLASRAVGEGVLLLPPAPHRAAPPVGRRVTHLERAVSAACDR